SNHSGMEVRPLLATTARADLARAVRWIPREGPPCPRCIDREMQRRRWIFRCTTCRWRPMTLALLLGLLPEMILVSVRSLHGCHVRRALGEYLCGCPPRQAWMTTGMIYPLLLRHPHQRVAEHSLGDTPSIPMTLTTR